MVIIVGDLHHSMLEMPPMKRLETSLSGKSLCFDLFRRTGFAQNWRMTKTDLWQIYVAKLMISILDLDFDGFQGFQCSWLRSLQTNQLQVVADWYISPPSAKRFKTTPLPVDLPIYSW